MGVWDIFNFIRSDELQDMVENKSKQILSTPDIVDMNNVKYTPLSLNRYGEYEGYNITTSLGYKFDLVRSYKMHIGAEKSYKSVMSLKVGDTVYLTPRLSHSECSVSMLSSSATYYLDDELARLTAIILAEGATCTEDSVLIEAIPAYVVDDKLITYLKMCDTVVLKMDKLYTFKIISSELIFMLKYKLNIYEDATPLFNMLLKAPLHSVSVFLDVYCRLRLSEYELDSKFSKEIQYLLFTRLGKVSKLVEDGLSFFLNYEGLNKYLCEVGALVDNNITAKSRGVPLIAPSIVEDTVVNIRRVKGEAFEIKADKDFESPILFGLY